LGELGDGVFPLLVVFYVRYIPFNFLVSRLRIGRMWQGWSGFSCTRSCCGLPALNTDVRSGTIAFCVAIGLSSCTLNNLVNLPWSFDGYLHVAEELCHRQSCYVGVPDLQSGGAGVL